MTTIMRVTYALGLIFLSSCAAGTQHPGADSQHPEPAVLQVSGPVQQVTSATPRKHVEDPKQERRIEIMVDEACQTNDPMPGARRGEPVPQMPRSQPLQVAPIPNACPVTVPWTSTTVLTSAPKTVPAPAATEPQP
ncbi:MAG TPA: hypothetical protein VFT45_05000 [Longimicrobium sp.]|nr:hypothetical protein [Longimicrobium sp.]